MRDFMDAVARAGIGPVSRPSDSPEMQRRAVSFCAFRAGGQRLSSGNIRARRCG